MFAVVKFVETNEVVVVPFNWLSGDQCSWPPKKIQATILPFIDIGIGASDAWESYAVHILGIYVTYNEAKLKLEKVEEKSGLNTKHPKDNDKRQKKRCKLSSSSSIESENIFTQKINLDEPPSSTPSAVKENNLRPHITELSQNTGTQISVDRVFTLSTEKDAVENFRDSAGMELVREEEKSDPDATDPEDCGRGKRQKKRRKLSSSSSIESESVFIHEIKLEEPPSVTPSSVINENNMRPYIIEFSQRTGTQNSVTMSTEKDAVENSRHSEPLPTASSSGVSDKQRNKPTSVNSLGFELQVLSNMTALNKKLDTLIRTVSSVWSLLSRNLTTRPNSSDSIDERMFMDVIKFLPLDSILNLESLEEKLEDESISDQMIYYLMRIGGSNCENATKLILRKLMTDSLAANFSFHGVRDKRPFKPLNLYKVIVAAVQHNFQGAHETDIIRTISNWLRQSPGRLSRKH